jgi:sec-independent protein translocase protein TatA
MLMTHSSIFLAYRIQSTPCYPVSMFSGWEGIVVIVIAVALFGSRLPKIARNLGQAQQEFKKGQSAGAKGTKDETPSNDTPQA